MKPGTWGGALLLSFLSLGCQPQGAPVPDQQISPAAKIPSIKPLPVKAPQLLPAEPPAPKPTSDEESILEFDRRVTLLENSIRAWRAKSSGSPEGISGDGTFIMNLISDLNIMKPYLKPGPQAAQVIQRYDQLIASLEEFKAQDNQATHESYQFMTPELKTAFEAWRKDLADYENTSRLYLQGDPSIREYLNSLELQAVSSARKVKLLLDTPQVQNQGAYPQFKSYFDTLAARQMQVIKLLEKK